MCVSERFTAAINSDLSVFIVCNKTGGTIKGDIKKNIQIPNLFVDHFYQQMGKQIQCKKTTYLQHWWLLASGDCNDNSDFLFMMTKTVRN